MKGLKSFVVILSILLISAVFEVSEAANWKRIKYHVVEHENEAAEILKVNIKNLHGEAEEVWLGHMTTHVNYAIWHQPSGSKAKSEVVSNIEMHASNYDFQGFATVRGTADAGFTKGFSNRKTDKGVLDANTDTDGNRQVQTSLVDSEGLPISLGADQFNAYKGWADSVTSKQREKWGDRESFRYTISHKGAVVLYLAMTKHPVHSGRGFNFKTFKKDREPARSLGLAESAGLEKQKVGNPNNEAILAMFSPYAEAKGESYNPQGKPIPNTVPGVSTNTNMPAAKLVQKADTGEYNFGVLFASNDSYSAPAGGTHEALMYLSHTATTVEWYVKASGESGRGTLMETDRNTDEASYSHTFASDASGDYVITAVVTTSTGSYEGSYTVTVGDGTSTTSTSTSTSTPSSTSTPAPTPTPTPISASLSPGNGSYNATVGDTHVATLTLSAAPSYVSWYIQDPWDPSPRFMYTDTSGNLTSQYSYYLGHSGDHVISVSGTDPSNGAAITASYTVSVSTSTPMPTSTPTLGITLADSSQTFQPGDSVTLDIVTADPFYTVSWYVHTPGDTSSYGTYQYDNYGDGTSTSGSFFYTIPSGAMHTGDYLFRAVIYRWSDMFHVGEETYTVPVQ